MAAYGLSAYSPRQQSCSATAFSGASSRQPCLRLPHYRPRLRAAAPIPAAAYPCALLYRLYPSVTHT